MFEFQLTWPTVRTSPDVPRVSVCPKVRDLHALMLTQGFLKYAVDAHPLTVIEVPGKPIRTRKEARAASGRQVTPAPKAKAHV